MGPNGGALSDNELTDFEHPPVSPRKKIPPKIPPQPALIPKQLAESPGLGTRISHESKSSSSKIEYKSSLLRRNEAKYEDNEKSSSLPRKPHVTKQQGRPIIVNISSRSLLKSPLEEKADTILSTPKKTKLVEGNNTKNIIDADPWDMQKQKSKNINPNKSYNYSDSLPIRGKNRTYSVQVENCSIPFQRGRSMSLRCRKYNTIGERKCVSANSSPCKINSGFTDSLKGSASLDRLMNKCADSSCDSTLRTTDFKSTETISSTATVDNFERELVSKIAERFALEDEFNYVDDIDKQLLTEEESSNPCTNSEEFYINDGLESVSAEPESNNNTSLQIYQCSSLQSSSRTLVDANENGNNTIICRNQCIGECRCGDVFLHETPIHQRITAIRNLCDYDSAEDTDERTDNELR